MTSISGSPQKRINKSRLFLLGVEALERGGWTVSRIPRGGKASLRQITKGTETHKVSIRTSQDAWLAFPRNSQGTWTTLDEVDFVVAVSVNDRNDPTIARVHMIPGDDARDRYNRAYEARRAAGHSLPLGQGIWLSMYDKESNDPVSYVGAGMGLDYPAIATLDLTTEPLPASTSEAGGGDEEEEVSQEEASLTIPEAKRRLAATLGVPESAIKITIEH